MSYSINFIQNIDAWIMALNQYDEAQIRIQAEPNSWSIGQVSMHLLLSTQFFLEQVKICASNNKNEQKKAAIEAQKMFFNNEFPDEIIEGPPSNATTPQAPNKAYLIEQLSALKLDILAAERLCATSPYKGKTRHPGLLFFNATEWLHFAEMHFRHHIRQKNRIEKIFYSK